MASVRTKRGDVRARSGGEIIPPAAAQPAEDAPAVAAAEQIPVPAASDDLPEADSAPADLPDQEVQQPDGLDPEAKGCLPPGLVEVFTSINEHVSTAAGGHVRLVGRHVFHLRKGQTNASGDSKGTLVRDIDLEELGSLDLVRIRRIGPGGGRETACIQR